MSIIVTGKESEIIVSSEEQKVIVTSPNPVVEVSSGGLPGAKGSDGEGVPVGGSSGQVLAKIDGDDYNTEWVDDANTVTWIDVAGDVEYTGVETAIASGEVLTADYKGGTIYRFINSTENANGYPLEDSFYSNFDGSNLTNLILTRGQ
tara:strand:- start:31 stop:474 length:444 start_codon:yes stop_codon:yes gene_type:complete